jgi:hypothetical protein
MAVEYYAPGDAATAGMKAGSLLGAALGAAGSAYLWPYLTGKYKVAIPLALILGGMVSGAATGGLGAATTVGLQKLYGRLTGQTLVERRRDPGILKGGLMAGAGMVAHTLFAPLGWAGLLSAPNLFINPDRRK